MKIQKLAFLILFVFVSFTSFGQDYAFKVLANKGTNEIKAGDSWQPIKTGASLKLGDELKISENGYIGLIHAQGKPVELKKAGNYRVTDLAANLAGGASVVSKYTDFILSSNSAESKKNRLSATGAVHRGDPSAPAETIHLILPDNQHPTIYSTSAIVEWRGENLKSPYIVSFLDMAEEELYKIETTDSFVKVDFTDPKIAGESAVLVQVKSKSDPEQISSRHFIKKISTKDREGVRKSLAEIAPVINEPTAINKRVLAAFYEENKLVIDAITAYQEAIALEPEVSSYREDYEDFLDRMGIKK